MRMVTEARGRGSSERVMRRGCRALHTLDVRGCTAAASREPDKLRELIPTVRCFIVHT